jgi:hypothetical protein
VNYAPATAEEKTKKESCGERVRRVGLRSDDVLQNRYVDRDESAAGPSSLQRSPTLFFRVYRLSMRICPFLVLDARFLFSHSFAAGSFPLLVLTLAH